MKQSEFEPCVCCGKGMMDGGSIVFYRVRVEYMLINVPAVNRQAGLEMSMGRGAPLAQIMGPNEDLAGRASDSTGLVCLECSVRHMAGLVEAMQNKGGGDHG